MVRDQVGNIFGNDIRLDRQFDAPTFVGIYFRDNDQIIAFNTRIKVDDYLYGNPLQCRQCSALIKTIIERAREEAELMEIDF